MEKGVGGTSKKKKITCEVGVKNIEMVLPGGCVMGVEEWNAGVWWALVKNNIERTTSSLDTKKKSDVWPTDEKCFNLTRLDKTDPRLKGLS